MYRERLMRKSRTFTNCSKMTNIFLFTKFPEISLENTKERIMPGWMSDGENHAPLWSARKVASFSSPIRVSKGFPLKVKLEIETILEMHIKQFWFWMHRIMSIILYISLTNETCRINILKFKCLMCCQKLCRYRVIVAKPYWYTHSTHKKQFVISIHNRKLHSFML